MAGLLRRQVPDSTAAQSLLADIMSKAKLANTIVIEMLEFVRPIRLQVERTDIGEVLHQAVTLAESKIPRGGVLVEMPPLRERKNDIVPLANAFIYRFSGDLKKKMEGLEPESQELLMRYNCSGNIRELENAMERTVLLAEGRVIAADDLRLGKMPTAGSGRDQAAVVKIPPTGIALEDIERYVLIEALKMSNWVQKDTLELLSISPRVMNYKIKTLGIEFPRGRRQSTLAGAAPPVAAAS